MEYASVSNHNNHNDGKGIIVANDLDGKRIQTLIHNLQRIKKNDNLVVTNISADAFPLPRKQHFDRIMCDVPCSGDGTLRKEPSIWTKWSPRNAIALHPIQLSIASRGVSLLKKGGIMAYSTCSLNVIENEAVVAELLRIHKGNLELLDVNSRLPKLKRRVGMTQWLVYGDDMTVIENPAPSNRSMFPPSDEEISWMNLDRCLRIVPMDQNTGGFFVAMFRKTGENEKKKKKSSRKRKKPCTDDLIYRKFDNKAWNSIKEYYGIKASDDDVRLVTRASGRVGYLIKKNLQKLVFSLQEDSVPIVIAGVKMVERLKPGSTGCDWRLRQEGLETILPFLTNKRVVTVSRRVFLDLLNLLPSNMSSREYAKLLKDPRKCSEFQYISTWKLDESARRQVNLLEPGCFVIRHNDLGLVSWLSGGRKSHFSIAHAGMHLQGRIESLRSRLLSSS
jgi:multisite-specific tRNA:(cytosine-C5)-methyltransferase